MSANRILTVIAYILFFLGFIFHYYFTDTNATLSGILFFIAVVLHSITLWGLWRSLGYFFIAMFIGYLAEFVGIRTGLIFGPYHYNPNIVGLIKGVPYFIPLMYAYLLYTTNFLCMAISKFFLQAGFTATHTITNSTQRFLQKSRQEFDLIVMAFLTGALLTLRDMGNDPIMSTIKHVWTWEQGGVFFGVPLHNFIGWFLVCAVMSLLATTFCWQWRNTQIKKFSKYDLLLPNLMFGALALFSFTSAVNVPQQYQNVGHSCAMLTALGLGIAILIAWFNGFYQR